MMYVILIGAVLVFWLVAIDRPVLKIKFNNGSIEQVKGHLPPSFKHNLQEIGHNNAFNGELKVYAKLKVITLSLRKMCLKACNSVFVMFSRIIALSLKARRKHNC